MSSVLHYCCSGYHTTKIYVVALNKKKIEIKTLTDCGAALRRSVKDGTVICTKNVLSICLESPPLQKT